MVFNQINKPKVKISNHYTYTKIIIKNLLLKYKKKFLISKYKNDKSIIDELRLIAQIRNIRDYKNKFKEDLIKAISDPKPQIKPEPKPEIKPEPKPEKKP